MGHRCRVVLMWVLLLALPLQGFAAATMLACGPDHHRMPAAAAAAPAHAHAHASGHAHEHGQGQGASADDLSKMAKFKCSACAACCMGAALPAAPLVFETRAPVSAPPAELPATRVGFLTDGPDRPPRPFLS